MKAKGGKRGTETTKGKNEEDEMMKFNLADKLLTKSGMNVRDLYDPRDGGAQEKSGDERKRGREGVNVCACGFD